MQQYLEKKEKKESTIAKAISEAELKGQNSLQIIHNSHQKYKSKNNEKRINNSQSNK